MTIDLGAVNYIAVIVGAVINMVLGALWYSPVLWAKPWMAANNVTEAQIRARGSANVGYAVAAVASFLISWALAVLVVATGADSPLDGLGLGLLAGLGFIMTSAAANYMFEARPLKLYLINAGYSLVGFPIIGILLGSWR